MGWVAYVLFRSRFDTLCALLDCVFFQLVLKAIPVTN